MKFANQGGYQPAMVAGLSNVLNEGQSFTTTENHIDFPNQVLHIPQGCVGIVQKHVYIDGQGSISVLYRDTITARRLIHLAEQLELLEMKDKA